MKKQGCIYSIKRVLVGQKKWLLIIWETDQPTKKLFSLQKIFYEIFFYNKKFLTKFSSKICFMTKFFLTKYLLLTNIFYDKKFFMTKNSLWQQFFSCWKSSYDEIFYNQKILGTKFFFLRKTFSWQKIF